jgi:hypothetical protein
MLLIDSKSVTCESVTCYVHPFPLRLENVWGFCSPSKQNSRYRMTLSGLLKYYRILECRQISQKNFTGICVHMSTIVSSFPSSLLIDSPLE